MQVKARHGRGDASSNRVHHRILLQQANCGSAASGDFLGPFQPSTQSLPQVRDSGLQSGPVFRQRWRALFPCSQKCGLLRRLSQRSGHSQSERQSQFCLWQRLDRICRWPPALTLPKPTARLAPGQSAQSSLLLKPGGGKKWRRSRAAFLRIFPPPGRDGETVFAAGPGAAGPLRPRREVCAGGIPDGNTGRAPVGTTRIFSHRVGLARRPAIPRRFRTRHLSGERTIPPAHGRRNHRIRAIRLYSAGLHPHSHGDRGFSSQDSGSPLTRGTSRTTSNLRKGGRLFD